MAMGDEGAREERPAESARDRAPQDATPDPGEDPEHRFSGDDESREGAAGASETRTPGMGS
jgi:hypothetical protein